jgi:hypothetical protein
MGQKEEFAMADDEETKCFSGQKEKMAPRKFISTQTLSHNPLQFSHFDFS